MKFTLFGMKFELMQVLIVVVVTLLILHLVGGCCRCNVKEYLTNMGSEINHKMGEAVKGSWDTREQKTGSSLAFREQDHDSYSSKMAHPDDSMHFFSNTDFSQDCCGSSYSGNGGLKKTGSSSGGCACLNTQQVNYINTRGGNRTVGGDF